MVTALAVPLLLVVVVSGVVVLLEDINPLVEVVLHLRAESEDDEARLLAPLPLLVVFVARMVKAIFALRFVRAGKFTFVWQLKFWITEDMCTNTKKKYLYTFYSVHLGISGGVSSPLYVLVGAANPHDFPSFSTTVSAHGTSYFPATKSFMNV